MFNHRPEIGLCKENRRLPYTNFLWTRNFTQTPGSVERSSRFRRLVTGAPHRDPPADKSNPLRIAEFCPEQSKLECILLSMDTGR
jgi:hypothetical protein